MNTQLLLFCSSILICNLIICMESIFYSKELDTALITIKPTYDTFLIYIISNYFIII